TFAHPADGDPNVVIEAYGIDDTSPTPLESDPVYKESDSDVIPTGSAKLTVGPADNEAYYAAEAIDTDALSYRWRFSKSGFLDPTFSDVATDEVSGTNFGAIVKVSAVASAISAIKDTEFLYLRGWVFNTASTVAADQQAAVRSAPISVSIPASVLRTRVLSGVLTRNYVPGSGWIGQLALVLDAGVASIKITVPSHLVASDEGPPPYNPAYPMGPWTYTKDATASYSDSVKVSGGSSIYYLPTLGGFNYVTVEPYSGAGGTGVAGQSAEINFTQTQTQARVKDESGYFYSTDMVEVKPTGSLAVDASSGVPKLKLRITLGTAAPGTLAEGELYGRHA
ncbi:MAG TPA: hypothetical protein VLH81_10455, partial [Desulfobacterales bacterium]|nr:hypothetical protein [Desulfobacterales bacterium]